MAAARAKSWVIPVLASVGLLLVCTALCLAFGDQPLTFAQVMTPESSQETIFFSLRLPRVILAALVGMALAAAGSTLQAMTRNPLADPFVLGVSGGSALGATVALALGLSAFTLIPGVSAVSVLALFGAIGATGVVMVVGRLAGRESSGATLLAGVIFNAFSLAAITFIKALVAPDKLGEVLFWLAGTLGVESRSTLLALAVVVLGSTGAMMLAAPRLNLLMLGEDDAQVLGLDVRRTRRMLLLLTSLAVSAAVSVAGLIGFVGLVVPHLVRLAVGADQRIAIPVSAICGAAFLMVADLGARVLFQVFNTEPPVGVLTSMIGGPLFLLLLIRSRRVA